MGAPKGNQYALNNEGGRPTKYKPEYCQKIIDFFSTPPNTIKEIEHFKNGEVSWKDQKIIANKLPTFHEFARSIGVWPNTIKAWCREHNEFLTAFNYAKTLQKYFLIENGLNGCYNSTAFVFTAKNITDMKDHTEQVQKIQYAELSDTELDNELDKLLNETTDKGTKDHPNSDTEGKEKKKDKS